jgi:hypothetical protein
MKHNITTYREAGLEAKWGKTSIGSPTMYVRDPNSTLKHQRESWWRVDRAMFDLMKKEGVKEGFNQATIIGDVFSI